MMATKFAGKLIGDKLRLTVVEQDTENGQVQDDRCCSPAAARTAVARECQFTLLQQCRAVQFCVHVIPDRRVHLRISKKVLLFGRSSGRKAAK
jgi:hypothetical protein